MTALRTMDERPMDQPARSGIMDALAPGGRTALLALIILVVAWLMYRTIDRLTNISR